MPNGQPSAQSRAHDPRLDALRGVAAIAVVTGHAILSVYRLKLDGAPMAFAGLFTLLSAISLPPFMFVAGRLARPERGLRWLGGRALRLLVPYAAWSVVQWLLWYRAQGVGFFGTAALDPSKTNALWFLYALFVMSAVLVALRGNRVAVGLVAVACLVLPWPDDRRLAFSYVALWFPVVAAGYLTRDVDLRPGPAWAAAFVALVAVLWVAPGQNLLAGAAPDWAMRLGTGGTVAFPTVATALLRTVRAAAAVCGVQTLLWTMGAGGPLALRRLGAMSLGIYCSHLLFVAYRPPQQAAYVFVSALGSLAAAVAVTWLLGKWDWTCFAFLGSGKPPWRERAA